MAKQLIEGYTDDTVRYCPYCGEPVNESNSENQYKCNNCECKFYVIEGD